MTMLVTRQQAADHLRIDDATAEADDLDLKILAASAVVLDYVEMSAEDFEGSDSDGEPEYPYVLQAATLLIVGDLHRHRDAGSSAYGDAYLPAPVRRILLPLKTWGLSSKYDDDSDD